MRLYRDFEPSTDENSEQIAFAPVSEFSIFNIFNIFIANFCSEFIPLYLIHTIP